MTGPHLTPEREAEIRAWLNPARERIAAGHVRDLLAALDAERAAHAQTRTALEASTALMIELLHELPRESMDEEAGSPRWNLDTEIQANQRVLGLAVAEADKPHDGNER